MPTTPCFIFPGPTVWSGEYPGRDAVLGFLRRFLDDGIVGEAHDILVNGPPWRTTVCVLFTVQADDAEGGVVYDNRAILFVRVRWGKIYYQEDFEDTHKSQAFAEHLARIGAPG